MRTSVLALFAALNRPALGAVPRDSVPMEAVTLVNCVERTGLAFSVMAVSGKPLQSFRHMETLLLSSRVE